MFQCLPSVGGPNRRRKGETTVSTEGDELVKVWRIGMKSNFLLNNIFGHFLQFFFFYWACSYRTPKSFACLRSLVTHSIQVYKVVNYRKYIILIFHIAVQIFLWTFRNHIHADRITPKPVHSAVIVILWSSLLGMLRERFIWFIQYDVSRSLFCIFKDFMPF